MSLNSRLTPVSTKHTPDFGLAQVNIVLLLVLFFLVTGTLVESEEQSVKLPETLDIPIDRLPRPLLLLGADGWILDGETVVAADLVERLAAQVEETGPDAPVHLLAPRTASADVVLAAMAALAPSGRPVLLVTVSVNGTESP